MKHVRISCTKVMVSDIIWHEFVNNLVDLFMPCHECRMEFILKFHSYSCYQFNANTTAQLLPLLEPVNQSVCRLPYVFISVPISF